MLWTTTVSADYRSMMRRETCVSVVLVILMASAFWPVLGQTVVADDERQEVFAPFASRLRVAVRDPQIRITWRDSEDLEDGSYQILRHTREITTETIRDATVVATVQAGTETWLDSPPEPGSYHYAVLALNAEGTLFPILIPFRNKTIQPVTVTRFETEEDLAVVVQNLAAQSLDTEILLRFDASRPGRPIAVYRSTSAILSLEDIAEATLLEEIDSAMRRFTDYPVPGIDYYYGIFDARLIERGTLEVQPGENTLEAPVRIALQRMPEIPVTVQPASPTRRAPLPILQPSAAVAGIRPSREVIPFGGEAQAVRPPVERAIERLLASAPATPPFEPAPIILPEERTVRGEGAARTLAQIVEDSFIPRNYEETVELLNSLLLLPLSPDFSRRVRFYLAQALFFSGERERAFMEFLVASRGSLYEASRPWIDGILAAP